jgi:hypothetical protein
MPAALGVTRTLFTWQSTIVVSGLAAVVLTFREYGISWDESTNIRYGELILGYFASGFRDRSVDEFINLRFYGPLYDFVVAAVAATAPDHKVEIRHLLNALTGLLILPALFRFGRLLEDPRIGLWAAVALGVMPVFYGHAFVNSKDVPFACAFTWSMVFLLELFLSKGVSWSGVAACGLAFGAAAAIRPGGMILLFPLLFLATLLAQVTGRLGTTARLSASKLCAIGGLTWLTMIAFWPTAHRSPLVHPLRSIRVAMDFPVVYPVLFEGRVLRSDGLPWYYLLKYVAITTPPITLVVAALGVGLTVVWLTAEPRRDRSYVAGVAAAWLLGPPAMWTLGRPNIIDGLRHFIFLLPALALFAGLGAATVVKTLRGGRARALGAAVATIVLLIPVRSLAQLHPYQMTYFNAFVGGLAGAAGNYETDYWLTSYKEAMEWIGGRHPSSGRSTIRVLVAGNDLSRLCAEHYARPGVEVTTIFTKPEPGALPPSADYYLATTRYSLHENYPESPIVHTVGRDGAVFSVVRRRAADGLAGKDLDLDSFGQDP